MKTLIYFLIAILLFFVAFASRDGSVGILAWIGIIFLIFALIAMSVRKAAAMPPALTALTGPITVLSIDRQRGSPIVEGFPFAGGTLGWMDVQVAGTHAFTRFIASVTDGESVTVAGFAGADFQILALRSDRTSTVYALPEPGFRRGEFLCHVVFYTLVLVPVLIGIFVVSRTTRGYNWTCTMRAAIAESRRLVGLPQGVPPPARSLDGTIRLQPNP